MRTLFGLNIGKKRHEKGRRNCVSGRHEFVIRCLLTRRNKRTNRKNVFITMTTCIDGWWWRKIYGATMASGTNSYVTVECKYYWVHSSCMRCLMRAIDWSDENLYCTRSRFHLFAFMWFWFFFSCCVLIPYWESQISNSVSNSHGPSIRGSQSSVLYSQIYFFFFFVYVHFLVFILTHQ